MESKIKKEAITPIKIVIELLLFVLCFGEFVDGRVDVGDYTAPFCALILGVDIYKSYKLQGGISEVIIGDTRWHKTIFSSLIIILLCLAVLLNTPIVSNEVRILFIKLLVVAWPATYLAFSLYELRNGFALKRVMICKIASMLFIYSLLLV